MTSRLKSRGGASGLEGGYGVESEARSIASAFTEGGDDGW